MNLILRDHVSVLYRRSRIWQINRLYSFISNGYAVSSRCTDKYYMSTMYNKRYNCTEFRHKQSFRWKG